ncbi:MULTISPECIES: DUF5374 domain-containing protein [Glaesserella]|uniref:DUF5374 domain-containing protein n=1 Tax=Glaesserella australis TaxID=2094024 RepID=A0A328C2N3_9PAST|nr:MULTISPECIES: DUF5374 domain-containing protein [Glaesserella]AUI66590.1 hypothetical protein CJD39_08400 [Glaesserella sp. 15-184]RAL18764.1 hypothetical protein C5N92_06425 [Glaesserella australis]
MNRIIKAESFISIMVVMLLFAIIYLSYSRWQGDQNKQTAFIFQQQQSLQLAENQIALIMANKPCENEIRQNNLTFKIECRSNELKVRFASGEIVLKKDL